MYEILIISLAALVASFLTFFSGFGLGTILLPVFGLFFSIETAIAATGLVHLGNNLFKLLLVGKNIQVTLFLKFGLLSVAGAVTGAFVLKFLAGSSYGITYQAGNYSFRTDWLKIIISILMILFALLELFPRMAAKQLSEKWFIPGGIVSGFFGGLSGHQGALRSIFLIKLTAGKEAYIATGTAIACLVDLTRLPVYFLHSQPAGIGANIHIILIPMLAAGIGAITGNRLLKKTTLASVQQLVAAGIILFALAMGSGLLNATQL